MSTNSERTADKRFGKLGTTAALALAGVAVTVVTFVAAGILLFRYARWPTNTVESLTFLSVPFVALGVWLLARRRYERTEAVIVALCVGLLSALVNYSLTQLFLGRA